MRLPPSRVPSPDEGDPRGREGTELSQVLHWHLQLCDEAGPGAQHPGGLETTGSSLCCELAGSGLSSLALTKLS